VAIVVILVLAILWAAVLLPPILRARSEGGGSGISAGVADFMGMFTSALGRNRAADPEMPGMQPLMGPVGPMGSMGTMGQLRPASGMTPAQRRRRDVLIGLLAAAGITLVMALFTGGSALFVVLHLLVDLLLGAYVYLLLQFKSRQAERRTKVRPLQPAGRHLRPVPTFSEPVHEPALALRRTASY
jgi:hypothetical protein